MRGRAAAGIVEAPGWRPILVVSAYGMHGGWNATTERMLHIIERNWASQQGSPLLVVAGDFNCSPAMINQKEVPQRFGATVVAPGTARGTFRSGNGSSTIDCFLVSDCASRLVRSVQPMEGTRVKGHVPVIMQFFPRASAWKALHIRNPPRMGKEAVLGPRLVPPTRTVPLRWVGRSLQAWRRGDRLGTQEWLDKAYGAWADIAERELAQIIGEEPAVRGHRGKCPRVTWKSILLEEAS